MKRYQFNDYILDSRLHALIRAEQRINIGTVAYKMLLYFVNNPNRIIKKDELISHVWENVIVTDASLYKQIQRLRDILNDTNDNKNFIETIHGIGFEFLPEVNTVDPTLKTQKTPPNKILSSLVIALLVVTIGIFAGYSLLIPPKNNSKTQEISINDAIFKMKSAMSINKKAFLSQIKIRNELGKLLSKHFDPQENLSWERKFFKYYNKMNEEEHFVFDQIRAYTDGPMVENNQVLLDLINNNPQILTKIPLAHELRNHLTLWLNKYHKIFLKNKKMALLYVGVEDGAPYPSEVDNQVIQWLQNHKNTTQ